MKQKSGIYAETHVMYTLTLMNIIFKHVRFHPTIKINYITDEKRKLFEQFPPVATRWMDRITSDLKGADFNRKLVWKTNEG